MTQYIKKVNKIEAIQNKGDILTDVLPFLKEHGIPYKYTASFLRGSEIGVITNRDNFAKEEYSQLNAGDYLVINKGVISIMSSEDFESKYQEDDGVGRKHINSEISTNINLDTTKAKQPHVRIEFEDIRDVPKVWVDGELIGGGSDDKPLINLKVDWNTDTAVKGHKEFDIRYYDSNDGIGKFKDCR